MALSPSTSSEGSGEPIRTMVVDDSAIIRGLISRMLEAESDIKVVASVGNGKIAVDQLTKTPDIDVIVLDIEMPVMDGLTALPLLLKAKRTVKIVMASTLTKKNAEVSLKAMQLGASDYVPKPTSSREIGGASDFKRDLVDRVRSLGQAHRRQTGGPAVGTVAKPAAGTPLPKKTLYSKPVTLREGGKSRPDILAIGSSTGGPQALFTFLKGIPLNPRTPIIITQHMPATFTSILAEHISRMTGWPCKEGENGEAIKGGQIYLAPGDFHMILEAKGVEKIITLNQDPPENFCRPAVDPMFRSVAKLYGGRALAAILTGMGADGAKGGKVLIDAGGTVIAQDEESSVVWGMPGAAATSGICSLVAPLEELSSYVNRALGRAI